MRDFDGGRSARRVWLPVLFGLASLAVALGVACTDDDEPEATQVAPTTTQPPSTAVARPTDPPRTPGGDAEVEVVGIVGAVNQADNRIEINRLSGADVAAVIITPATRIVSGQGRPLTLADLRPSDRIIASGSVDGAELTAALVEIQAVVPGASPGG